MTLKSAAAVSGWAGFGAILVLSLVPGSLRPPNVFGLPGQYEHLLAYTLTAGALSLASSKARLRVGSLILLVLTAALLETAQISIPGRTARVLDFAASSSGAGLGLLAAALLDYLIFPRSPAATLKRRSLSHRG